MSKWVPVERFDGSAGWVDTETGEIAVSMYELITGRSWDLALDGLAAAVDVGAIELGAASGERSERADPSTTPLPDDSAA